VKDTYGRRELKRLLIVSPHFPPVNAPDMQRVRMSLPYFREFGWQPYVLAVAPGDTEIRDLRLNDTVPSDVPVERVRSIPAGIAGLCGIGNVALRAWPYLYASGCRLISKQSIDLVYFSTTMFFSMPLGRIWKRKYGIPYVVDMQDPWLANYYETHPEAKAPPKYSAIRRLNSVLEPWTLKKADGVIAVSPSYIDVLRQRYPVLADRVCAVVPFGVSTLDFKLICERPEPNPFFASHSGHWHGVYTGAAGDIMRPALRVLFGGLRLGLASNRKVFEHVRLHFIGTAYAKDARARRTVEPVAAEFAVAQCVGEQTARIRYFEALQVIHDADCLVLIGSDDPAYVASKLHTYALVGKPILAIVHEASRMIPLLRQVATILVTFSSDRRSEADASIVLAREWGTLLAKPSPEPRSVPSSLEAYSAREVTRQQCSVFDRVVDRREGTAFAS